ncbi:MAG: hypothetical protein HC805_00115 [Alkalinema sp. RL_2_19]|nr:hypothetical protein [Alkalinema sp. RL_2_19]
MPGMLTGNRMVRLEVTGLCQQSISHASNYTVTVPYASMSSTIQNISRMGAKVIGVHVSDIKAAAANPTPEAAEAAPKKTSKRGKKK